MVGFAHLSTGLVDKREVELLQFRVPTSLAMVEVLGCAEEGEVLVIRPNLDRVRGSKEVQAPFTKRFHDRKEFLVVDIVISFRLRKALRAERNRLPSTVNLL